MELVHTFEPMPTRVVRSIFLAGPTPRTAEARSWRPEALAALERHRFSGTVFVPEMRAGPFDEARYDECVAWEDEALRRADCICFWVPRDLTPDVDGKPRFAGLTTNVEFGRWERSGKVVFGALRSAEANRYLWNYAKRHGLPRAGTLDHTVQAALVMVEDGAVREGVECAVPLCIWRTPSFQAWTREHRVDRDELRDARVEWVLRVEPHRPHAFAWEIRATWWVTAARQELHELAMSWPTPSGVTIAHMQGSAYTLHVRSLD